MSHFQFEAPLHNLELPLCSRLLFSPLCFCFVLSCNYSVNITLFPISAQQHLFHIKCSKAVEETSVGKKARMPLQRNCVNKCTILSPELIIFLLKSELIISRHLEFETTDFWNQECFNALERRNSSNWQCCILETIGKHKTAGPLQSHEPRKKTTECVSWPHWQNHILNQ